jgi:hypothetical protein
MKMRWYGYNVNTGNTVETDQLPSRVAFELIARERSARLGAECNLSSHVNLVQDLAHVGGRFG